MDAGEYLTRPTERAETYEPVVGAVNRPIDQRINLESFDSQRDGRTDCDFLLTTTTHDGTELLGKGLEMRDDGLGHLPDTALRLSGIFVPERPPQVSNTSPRTGRGWGA